MRDRRLVSMEPIPVDTYNIRLVYLILTTFAEKGILMPILQKRKLGSRKT